MAYRMLHPLGTDCITMKTEELIVEPKQQYVVNQNLIQLPYGLLGFEKVKNYVLLANPQEEPFM